MPEFPKLPKMNKNPLKTAGSLIKEAVSGIQQAARDIDSAVKDIDSEVRAPIEGPKTPIESISEQATFRYQLDRLLDDLQHLETEHLPAKGRIEGQPCDCIAKAARDLRRHASETIPIASRQSEDPKIFSDIASVASYLMETGNLDAVNSGKYDDEYLIQAGIVSNFRKEIDRILRQVKRSYTEECKECEALEDLKSYLERRKTGKI